MDQWRPCNRLPETDPSVALDGHIAIQIHAGGFAIVQAKDITIEELPPTPGAPTWDKVGHPKPIPTRVTVKMTATAATPAPATTTTAIPQESSFPPSIPRI